MKGINLILLVLVVAIGWSCSSDEFGEVQNSLPAKKVNLALSRSVSDVGNIDYSQYVLLEPRIVLPRSGEYYQGTVAYMGTAFPLHIFWDLEIENYNIYAYASGVNVVGDPGWVGDISHPNLGDYYGKQCKLDHVATYLSECRESRFDLVIKCNFSSKSDTSFNDWGNHRHVAFHVIFFPASKNCSFDIIEEGEGVWRMLEID